jgi:hypothetical protein
MPSIPLAWKLYDRARQFCEPHHSTIEGVEFNWSIIGPVLIVSHATQIGGSKPPRTVPIAANSGNLLCFINTSILSADFQGKTVL